MATPPAPNHVSWRNLYARVRMETDHSKLAELIQSVEAAMFARYPELTASSDHETERSEMQSASHNLLRIKTETLGWPGMPELDVNRD
ncbi:MAG: hypothetical protein WA823_01185 [Candidatus Acidiferrales bacterium]